MQSDGCNLWLTTYRYCVHLRAAVQYASLCVRNLVRQANDLQSACQGIDRPRVVNALGLVIGRVGFGAPDRELHYAQEHSTAPGVGRPPDLLPAA